MGKKPLVGLIGLVTAGMLVTAGCDCCHKNTRNGDGYKPAPAFPTKNAKADTVTGNERSPDKDASPLPPTKPADLPTTPLPGDNKTAPQASLTPPNGSAPVDVKTLSPNTQGFGTAQLTNASPSRLRMPMPAPPTIPQRASDVRPTSMDAPANTPNNVPAASERTVPLPPIDTSAPLSPPPPPQTMPPAPSTSPMPTPTAATNDLVPP